jgi:hypothetical protein
METQRMIMSGNGLSFETILQRRQEIHIRKIGNKSETSAGLRDRSLTFADIPDRYIALTKKPVSSLLELVPFGIRSKLIGGYLRNDLTSSMAMDVADYMCGESAVMKIIRETPSSALAFEYLYGRAPTSTADNFICGSDAGRHVYLRLKAMVENLPTWIAKFAKEECILIDNIASGPGHDMIEILAQDPELAKRVHVRNIDPDAAALAIGQERVKALGLEESFSFHAKPFHKVKRRSAHIVLAIGFLCTMDMATSLKVLRLLKNYTCPGGYVIYSSNQVSMLVNDPFTDYLMRQIGWHMDYKSDEESASLASMAGLSFVTQFFDEERHFQCMTVAQP